MSYGIRNVWGLLAATLLTGWFASPLCGASATNPLDPIQRGPEKEEEPFDFKKLLERDRGVSFPPRAGQSALGVLQSEGLAPPMRTAALLTLGETETSSGRSIAEAWMKRGTVNERRAAILAWGQMGAFLGGEDPFLVELLNDPRLPVAESALFALYMHTPGPVLERLAYLVARPEEPLFHAAEHILEWHERTHCSKPGPVSDYLELRWSAARSFGTIEGQLWSAHLVDLLSEDQAFLDGCILPATGSVLDPRVQDHLYELLLRYPNDDGPVLAALERMPGLLDRMVAGDLWAPTTESQHNRILEVAEAKGLARFIPNLLARMALNPDYTLRVSGWLASIDPLYQDNIEENLRAADPSQRAMAARAAGQANLPEWGARLRDLSRDPNAAVRLEALVARVRGGDEQARGPLMGYFTAERVDVTNGVRDRAMRLMLNAHNSRVLDVAQSLMGEVPNLYERAVMATILTSGGRTPSTRPIRSSSALGLCRTTGTWK